MVHKQQQKPSKQRLNVKEKSSSRTDDSTTATTGRSSNWIILRFFFIICVILAANIYYRWQHAQSNISLASAQENITRRRLDVQCSSSYLEESHKYPECFPRKCGRIIMDNLVDEQDASTLLRLAKFGMSYGGSSGGASILDLESGALSKGTKFINLYSVIEDAGTKLSQEMSVYKKVRSKIQHAIAAEFNIPATKLYLTKPTFFSRMDTKPSQTVHDEYWHVHVDKETYETFHYTSLLYLNNYGEHFSGGRFTFVDEEKNSTVEPRLGRLSFFTSGQENPHFVEKVESGTRFAITVSFTCDKSKAISDPNISDKISKQ